MMKFSDETLSVLKNFAQINPSVMFRPGNVLKTISPQKTVIAMANVDESFDTNAGVYDLSRFLSTISLFDNPDINFGSDRFTISSNSSQVRYTYASENMIMLPPEKDIKVSEKDWEGEVQWSYIQSVIRAAGVLGVSHICFEGSDSGVSMSAIDPKNPTSDDYSVQVSTDPANSFKMLISVDTMKLMPNDYYVTLSSQGLAHFKSDKVQYWVALEAV